MGNKNKSVSSKDKSKKPKESKGKKDKKQDSERKEVAVFINEQEATKIITSTKVITVQELARQTNVKISTANEFLKKSLAEGIIKKLVDLVVIMSISLIHNKDESRHLTRHFLIILHHQSLFQLGSFLFEFSYQNKKNILHDQLPKMLSHLF